MRGLLFIPLVFVAFFSCNKNKCNTVTLGVDDALLQKGIEELDQYLLDSGITAISHSSGLRYVVHEEGTGTAIEPCMAVFANYAGYLLDGTCFDTSIESVAKDNGILDPTRSYMPFGFYVAQGQVISGWDIGFQLLKNGTKATLYLPSELAYGETGSGSGKIPPGSHLVFYVEVVDAYVP